MPGFEEISQLTSWEHRDFNWRKLTTRLAIEEYRARNGAPPATLQELVPKYLPTVPQDPFALQPLVYKRKGIGTGSTAAVPTEMTTAAKTCRDT